MVLSEHFVHLIEAMPDGVVVTDRDGIVIHANGLFERMSGYPVAELIGKPVDALVPSNLRLNHVGHREDYYQRGMPARPMGAGLDIRLQRADGSELPVDIALSTLEVGETTLVLASLRDVSGHKRAEATISEGERRWSELLENVQLVVVAIDLGGRVTYANPYVLRLTGYTADEVITRDWFETFVPEHVRAAQRTTLLAPDTALPRQHTHDIVTRDGLRRAVSWFHTRLQDADGTPRGVISIGEDITDRRRVDARSRALNEVAQAILTGGSPENLLHQVARSAARLLNADVGALLVPLGDQRFEVRAVAGDAAEAARGRVFNAAGLLVDEVVTTGRSVSIANVQDDPTTPNLAALGDIGPALLVPLWVRGDPFGVLLLANHPGGRAFDLDDAVEEEAFASQAAVALTYERAQHEVRRLGVLAERERIARELHDTVIQRLFASGMRLQAALGKEEEALRDAVNQIVEDLDGLIRDIRSTIFSLQSSEEAGLRDAAVSTIVELTPELGFEPRIRFSGPIDTVVGEHLRSQAVGILRAALRHIARHAGADHVYVEIVADTDLRLTVADDGTPWGDHAVVAQEGVLTMAPRAGGGTVVEWRVALDS